ncbi:MAG: hypothetical protein AAGE98_20780 [Actinomycetota bacterium]
MIYQTDDGWRYAVSNQHGILDGRLPDVDAAQAALQVRAEEATGVSYRVSWKQDKPGWWSADVEIATT